MFTCFSALGRVLNACTWYRIATPFRGFQLAGAGAPLVDEWQEVTSAQVAGADFHLYYLRGSRTLLKQIHEFRRARSLRRQAPHVIFDADDHVERISMWNPRYCQLGTRTPDGIKLTSGDRLLVQYDNEDEPIELWRDGTPDANGDIFNVPLNHARLNILKICARAADGVSCSTDYLANVYRGYGCKNVTVFPNSLLEEDYPEIRPQRPKNVTILWQGGHAHYEDWLTILEPLGKVLRKRPNVRFIVWGSAFPAIRRAVPPSQYRHIPWVPYEKYTLRLATIGHHINLCPLIDDPFNNAKSAIKWMESSAITVPAATLAANVGPYKAIQHGETGMLYNSEKEFERYLLELIDNASLRRRLARQAREHVWDTYHISKTIQPLIEWYRGIQFRSM